MISTSKPVLRSVPSLSAVFRTTSVWATGAVAAFITVVRNRRQLKELRDLDDLLLADIGLSRVDVERASRMPLFSDPTVYLAERSSSLPARPRGRRGDLHVVPSGRLYP